MRPYKRGAFLGLIVIGFIVIFALSSFAGTTLYTYDSLYRLSAVEYGGWTKVEYSYDEVGNPVLFN